MRSPGRWFLLTGERSRAVAVIRAAIVMRMAIGSVCGSSLGGTNATAANATATPPMATDSAVATRRVRSVRRTSAARFPRQPVSRPGEARDGGRRQHGEPDGEREPVHVHDGGHPQHEQRDQHEDVDHPGHRAHDDHVDVPAVDVLAWRGPRRVDEVPDRAHGVVPAQPDPAELVHRAAVRRVKRERALLVPAGRLEVARGPAPPCRTGSARRARSARGGGPPPRRRRPARAAPAASAAWATHTWVCQYDGARAAATRQPRAAPRRGCPRCIRALDASRCGHSSAGSIAAARLAASTASTYRSAPRWARANRHHARDAARLGGDEPGEQGRGLVVAPEVEHGGGPRQLLPKLRQVGPFRQPGFRSAGAYAGMPRDHRMRRPRWRTAPRSARCRTRCRATAGPR